MHAKTDSDMTSLAPSSPSHSPNRRQIYFVMSPTHNDAAEKISIAPSSPDASPRHHQPLYYAAASPIHHSGRSSSTTRFSASIKYLSGSGPAASAAAWHKLGPLHPSPSHLSATTGGGTVSDDEDEFDRPTPLRCYVLWFILAFVMLFSLFSLILWAASKAYKPHIAVKSVVFESYNVQAGMDLTGVPTKMLSLNSTVKIWFRNPATFFGVHVSSTPLEYFYYDLKIADGHMKEFYQSRKSGRTVTTVVLGSQVPLYGGGSNLTSRDDGDAPAVVPVSLTFTMRARANVLGHLVKSKFYRRISCNLVLRESHLGKQAKSKDACVYHT